MAQYFLPVEFDKYIVLDQDLLPFSLQIITGLAFLYQFSYGPGLRGHNNITWNTPMLLTSPDFYCEEL